MTDQFILVKDIQNNTFTIFDNGNKEGYDLCIEYLEQKTNMKFNKIVVPSTSSDGKTNDICELFCDKETLQKGWIWNNKINESTKMYSLSFVEIANKKEKKDTFTETIVIINNKEVQTESKLQYSPINYFKYEIDEDNLYDFDTNWLDKYKCKSNKVNCNLYLHEKGVRNDIYGGSNSSNFNIGCKIYEKEIAKVNCKSVPLIQITPISPTPISPTQITPTPISPTQNFNEKKIDYNMYSLNDKLIDELKENLKCTNFGLRKRRNNKKKDF